MTREDKTSAIENLKEKLSSFDFFYLADASSLTVEKVGQLRRKFYDQGIEMMVVKNTLARKAMESLPSEKGYEGLYDSLHGPTAILFTTVANAPARVIEEFRKNNPKPLVKAAYIDTAVFLGDEQLEKLAKLKSKEELIGELIGLLQSPAKNVISALKSGGSTIAGLVKTLQDRAN